MSSSKNNPHGLVTGQTLYYVPRRLITGDSAGEVVVTSVGRKWAGIGSGGRRIALDTLIVDGGIYNSPGRCYLSQEAYFAKEASTGAWRALRGAIVTVGTPPVGVTVERIKQAAELLGLSWGE